MKSLLTLKNDLSNARLNYKQLRATINEQRNFVSHDQLYSWSKQSAKLNRHILFLKGDIERHPEFTGWSDFKKLV